MVAGVGSGFEVYARASWAPWQWELLPLCVALGAFSKPWKSEEDSEGKENSKLAGRNTFPGLCGDERSFVPAAARAVHDIKLKILHVSKTASFVFLL